MPNLPIRSLLLAVALSGCGNPANPPPDAGGDAGAGFWTASTLRDHLEGKTLRMAGQDIPSHPNGYSEDLNLDESTQCYHAIELAVQGGAFHADVELGTLYNAHHFGESGQCDRTTISGRRAYTSVDSTIENVQGDGGCFDFTIAYDVALAQEGRGRIAPDGSTLTLELYFAGHATGHRCADGPVGSPSVWVDTRPLSGDAQQVYRLSSL